MSNDLNQCNFIGRLGKDIEARYAPSGDAIANFSIAVGSAWKDKATGEKKESTEWVNIAVFGSLAEICIKYLVKGSQIYISGKQRTRKWQDKEGNDKYTTEIVADRMQMLGSKDSKPAEPPQDKPRKPMSNDENGFKGMEDSIPF